MGMTDRQFDSYHARLLRLLIKIEEEVKAKGESKELEELIKEIERELKRP